MYQSRFVLRLFVAETLCVETFCMCAQPILHLRDGNMKSDEVLTILLYSIAGIFFTVPTLKDLTLENFCFQF
jgi:hypothetical protein